MKQTAGFASEGLHCCVVASENAAYIAYTYITDLPCFYSRFPRQKFMSKPMELAVAGVYLP